MFTSASDPQGSPPWCPPAFPSRSWWRPPCRTETSAARSSLSSCRSQTSVCSVSSWGPPPWSPVSGWPPPRSCSSGRACPGAASPAHFSGQSHRSWRISGTKTENINVLLEISFSVSSNLVLEMFDLVADLLDSVLVLFLLSLAVLEDCLPLSLHQLDLLLHLRHLLEYRPPGPSHLATRGQRLHVGVRVVSGGAQGGVWRSETGPAEKR